MREIEDMGIDELLDEMDAHIRGFAARIGLPAGTPNRVVLGTMVERGFMDANYDFTPAGEAYFRGPARMN